MSDLLWLILHEADPSEETVFQRFQKYVVQLYSIDEKPVYMFTQSKHPSTADICWKGKLYELWEASSDSPVLKFKVF